MSAMQQETIGFGLIVLLPMIAFLLVLWLKPEWLDREDF